MSDNDTGTGTGGPARRRLLVALAAAAVVLLLAGVVSVAVGRDDPQDAASTGLVREDDASTTTAKSGSSTTGATEGTTGSTAPTPATSEGSGGSPGGAPQTTVPGGGPGDDADAGTPGDPGPVSPPAAGTYRYRTVADDGEERIEDTVITDVRRGDGEVVQRVRGEQGGFETDDTVVWTADRVVVRESIYRFGDGEGKCDWEPDVVQALLPLTVGATWSNDSRCTITGFGPTPVLVRQTTNTKVLRVDRRRIAGEVLDLWVIEGDGTVEFSGFEVQGQVTAWFSPRHGLIVRTEGTASGNSPDGSGSGSFTSEIQDLSPG